MTATVPPYTISFTRHVNTGEDVCDLTAMAEVDNRGNVSVAVDLLTDLMTRAGWTRTEEP